MAIKKIPPKEFVDIYSRVPRLCVEVIVMTPNGVALTVRDIEPCIGQWHIPGGTVFKGETLEQAVCRVAKEELGIKVKVEKLLGIIEYKFRNYYSQPVGVAYLVRPVGGRDVSINSDASEWGIFKTVPHNTIKEQKTFLETYVLKKKNHG
jgi:ADP-ribose pyrophosphatase YjhB (NUDIX family)